MQNRFIALLLILVFASQAAASAMPCSANHGNADDVTDQGDAPLDHGDCAGKQAGIPAEKTDCPCCVDAAATAAGCVNYCSVALAVFPVGVSFAARFGATYAPLMTQPLVTRSDIPPTPPPIA